MTQSTKQTRNTESGFTLVELAIVMIIIGLLIGGILKGQELITNARVSATVAQVKAVESGISGFRDKYAGMPGDIATPNTRLPGCPATNPCGVAGAGGTIGDSAIQAGAALDPGAVAAITTESGLAFIHLAAAGLIGGVQPGATLLGAGQTNPTTPLGGHWAMATSNGVATGVILPAGLTNGVYIQAKSTAVGAVAVGNDAQIMAPSNAANIDRKLDDGRPNTGSVRAVGVGGNTTTNCASLNTDAGVYNEALGAASCGVIAKVQ